jgi:hypothetical protein
MLGDGPEEPGENVRIYGVDDYPERGLYEQGLVLPSEEGVQEREASVNEELHDDIIEKK